MRVTVGCRGDLAARARARPARRWAAGAGVWRRPPAGSHRPV